MEPLRIRLWTLSGLEVGGRAWQLLEAEGILPRKGVPTH